MYKNSYSNKKENKSEQDVLNRLKEKMNLYINIYQSAIEDGSNQRNFSYGSQWDDAARDLARANGISPLSQNEISKHIKAVVAEFSNNMPTPTVEAVSPKLNPKTADLFSAVINKTVNQNGFSEALTLAYEDALRTGCGGGIYVYTDFINDKTFKKDIYFKYISYTDLFFDPYAQLPNKSDGDFCGYLQRISTDEFKKMFPDINVDDVTNIDKPFGNYNKLSEKGEDYKSITVAHIFERQFEDKKLYLTNSGRTIEDKEDLKDDETIITSRTTKKSVIYSYVIDGHHILRKSLYPIDSLPLVYVSGYQAIINGAIKPYSFGYDVFDIQKIKNWGISQLANMLLNLRKENFVVDIKDMSEKMLLTFINPMMQQGCIPYDSSKNQPPTQLRAPELSTTLINLIGDSSRQIDNILGRFEDVQGASKGEISGIARQLSIMQNNISLYFYVRHAVTAVCQVCKIISQFLPKTYVEERLITDENTKIVLNGTRDYDGMENLSLFNLNLNDLNVDVKVGPSFEIQKQQYMEAMAALIQKLPEPLNTVLLPDLLSLYEIPNSAAVNKKIEQVMKLTNPPIGEIMEGVSDEKLEEQAQSAKMQQQQTKAMQQQLMQYEMQAQKSKQQIEQASLALKTQEQQLSQLKALSEYQVDTERLDQNAQKMALDQSNSEKRTTAEITKAYLDMMGSKLSS